MAGLSTHSPSDSADTGADAQQALRLRTPVERPASSASDLLGLFQAHASPSSRSTMSSEARDPTRRWSLNGGQLGEEIDTPVVSPSPSTYKIGSYTTPPRTATWDNESTDELHAPTPLFGVKSASNRPTPSRTLPNRSTRKQVYHGRPERKSTPRSATKTPQKLLLKSDAHLTGASLAVKPLTARSRIRHDIAANTKVSRDAFILRHRDHFLPLLPEHNYIVKLHSQGEVQQPVPYRLLEKQPQNVRAVMKPYQLEGLSFLINMYENGMSAILGDEMGLGKTLQTLSLFQYLEENHPSPPGEPRPYLVVCPLSVLSSWAAEARKWTPNLKVLRFHGAKSERAQLKLVAHGKLDRAGNDLRLNDSPFDVMVTTYETFVSEQGWFKKALVWRYCVLDEGHKIKNEKSNVSHALQGLAAEFRLLLTGTPLQNNLHEMWALLHWLFPDIFTAKTADNFKDAFNLTAGKVSLGFIDHARRLLELVMLRRLKQSPGVNLGLPPKEEILLFVPLTPMQRFWYTRLLTRMGDPMLDELFKGSRSKEQQVLAEDTETGSKVTELEQAANPPDEWSESRRIMHKAVLNEQADSKKTTAWQKLMNLIMQLRKVCTHPYILQPACPDPYKLGEHVVKASGKFMVLDKLVQELVIRQGKKILIFSCFTGTLDLCEDLLTLKGGNTIQSTFRYHRLDGATGRAKRNLAIRMFNDQSSEFKVMLISTRAGGLGINLASASDVVFMDEDWNPQITLQAEARAHRIGQTNPVTVYKLCTQGTVEEQMIGRIRKKLYLSAKVTESMQNIYTPTPSGPASENRKGGSPSPNIADEGDGSHLGTSQLISIVRRGATTLTHPELDITDMLRWDWKTTVEECKDHTLAHDMTDTATSQTSQTSHIDEEAWLSKMERVETAVLNGVKYQREADMTSEAQSQYLDRKDRRIGKNTTVMMDGFAISKESLNCDDWEAVPTLAGKDPRLADTKREKAPPITHQEHCQVCFEGGSLVCCSSCPRSYHSNCLTPHFQAKALGKVGFHCPQHSCTDCGKNTTDAGGLIYRCRWCERGYCEDCLDWDTVRLVGETLKEYEMLGFEGKPTAWYIECPRCVEQWVDDKATEEMIESEKESIDGQYVKYVKGVEEQEDMGQTQQAQAQTADSQISHGQVPVPTNRPYEASCPTALSTVADLLSEATTQDSSGVPTPVTVVESPMKKRKLGSHDALSAWD